MKMLRTRSAAKRELIGFLVVLPLLLASCGGGGENAAVADDPDLRGGATTATVSTPSTTPMPTEAIPVPSEHATEPCDGATPTATPSVAPSAGTPGPEHPTPPASTPSPMPPVGGGAVQQRDVDFPGCEDVMAEGNYCLTTAGNRIALLGLDSGQLCPVTETDAFFDGGDNASIAWLGEEMYVCGYDAGLMRISLRDGSVETAGVPCQAVTDYRGGLLVSTWPSDPFSSPLRWYADFASVQRGDAGADYSLGSWSERMTVNGDIFVGAWHSTDHLDVGDLSTDQPLGVLTLERDDGWVYGLSVTNDGLLALSEPGGDGGGTVVVFDLYTGRRVRAVDTATELAGLACTSRVHTGPPPKPTPPPPPATPVPTECVPRLGDDGSDCPRYDCGALPDPGRPDFPPSIPIATNCGAGGYTSSNYAIPGAADEATQELHVIGVYEAKGNSGFRPYPQGLVDVVVHPRPKPVVLFLSAYESVLWRVTLESGAELARVITQGYEQQAVTGVPDGVAVEYRGPEEVCGYAYGWEVENNSGGGSYQQLIATARDLTGLTETSFQGCYTGDRFEIPYWSGAPPTERPTPVPGDETIPREQVRFPGCEAVTAERQYCLTTTYGAIALLGLDTGQVCPLTDTSAGVGDPLVASIAWRGELMYACTGRGLVRISLRDGAWEAAQVACGGAAEYGGGLLLSASLADPSSWFESPLRAYPDYAAVLSGELSRAFELGRGASQLTVHADTLYSAGFSTDTIDVADLSTGEERNPIHLDGYDGWILGMAVTDDGQLVISGDTWGDTVRVFDASTGTHVRDLHPTTPVFGLSCMTRE